MAAFCKVSLVELDNISITYDRPLQLLLHPKIQQIGLTQRKRLDCTPISNAIWGEIVAFLDLVIDRDLIDREYAFCADRLRMRNGCNAGNTGSAVLAHAIALVSRVYITVIYCELRL